LKGRKENQLLIEMSGAEDTLGFVEDDEGEEGEEGDDNGDDGVWDGGGGSGIGGGQSLSIQKISTTFKNAKLKLYPPPKKTLVGVDALLKK
jgi:hypothetical protein